MGFLFEPEISQILHTVRGQTIGEAESITMRQILVSPIHPALKTYFKAEVEKILERERATEVRSARFPYAHPEVVSLQHQVDLLLVQYYQFPHDEFERVLDEAVHFQFNYLCRPQFTLLEYIAGDRRRIPVSQIVKKLNRCVEYEYFPELIRRYCDERGLAEVTYEEFRTLLSRIDAEVVSRHTSEELAAMTRGILLFVDFGRATPHDEKNQPTLPTNAAIVFFEDKGLEQIKSRLETERDSNGKELMTMEELTQVLREVWSDSVDGNIVRVADPGIDANPRPQSASHAEATPEFAKSKNDVKSVPELKVVKHSMRAETQFTNLGSLFDYFSRKETKRFVRSIFQKDDKAFREALTLLNECWRWDEASHHLDTIFVSQNVDPFSKEAVEFTDKVYARYFPK